MTKSGIGKFFRYTFRTLVTLLLVGGWTLAVLSLHVILVPPSGDSTSTASAAETSADASWHRGWLDFRLVVVPKNRLGFGESFVDTRDWTLDDAAAHDNVVQRLADLGRLDTIDHVTGNTIDTAAQRKLDELLRRD